MGDLETVLVIDLGPYLEGEAGALALRTNDGRCLLDWHVAAAFAFQDTIHTRRAAPE